MKKVNYIFCSLVLFFVCSGVVLADECVDVPRCNGQAINYEKFCPMMDTKINVLYKSSVFGSDFNGVATWYGDPNRGTVD